jgi:hypothetical protein
MSSPLERRVTRLEQKTGTGEPTYLYVHTGVSRFEGDDGVVLLRLPSGITHSAADSAKAVGPKPKVRSTDTAAGIQ